MIALSRTDLTTPEKAYLGAATIAMRGTYGGLSDLARDFEVSRPTLYSVSQEVRELLQEQFEPQLAEPGVLHIRVDRAQLERAAVALRCEGPNSIPSIREMLHKLYPGLKLSVGKLHGILAEAENKARDFNSRVVLSKIVAAALDEIFSQGQPILSGIDLDSGYVAILTAQPGRSGNDWAEGLRAAKGQGFKPDVVVKDAALGLAAGVTAELPEAEQRDDCFHAAYELGKVLGRLERSAYAAIENEHKAALELEKLKKRGGIDLRKPAQRKRRASGRCRKAVELFDSFESATRDALEALEAVNLRTMQMRGPGAMRAELLESARRMRQLPDKGARKAGRYLKNRTPGLVRYCEELHAALIELDTWSIGIVRWASVLWHAAQELDLGRKPWLREVQGLALQTAWSKLTESLPVESISSVVAAVAQLFAKRHRASSAIEGFHAALRPHLYVHKGFSQGFLELFRAYSNLRPARSGPRKGTSAYERLTGQPVEDWLTMLGYPPSASRNSEQNMTHQTVK